jgi:phenylalanyl-tRNA synthetase beta chain
MREIAGGQPLAEIGVAGEIPRNGPDVPFSYEKSDRLLGIPIAPSEADALLERFGLKKSKNSKATSTWTIPSYRRDLQRDVDLIEEVVRAYGVDKIAGTDRSRFTATSEADRSHDFEAAIRQHMVARGISEVRTSTLISRAAQGGAFVERALELRNPLSEDHVMLRPSLLPGMLGIIARNIRSGAESIRLFELGRVFDPAKGNEGRRLAYAFTGRMQNAADWRGAAKRTLDFFDLKGALAAVTHHFQFRATKNPDLGLAAEIVLEDKIVGCIGQLAARHASILGAENPVFVAEINLDALDGMNGRITTFRELEKFPAVTRDIAMIVPESITHAEVLAVIEGAKEPLLERVALFDVFGGKQAENLGVERKSLAYTLTYRDRNRTLTNDEVTVVHARIRERLKRELGAELRE